MFRIDNATSKVAPPTMPAAGTEKYFGPGNPATQDPATIVDAWWFHQVTEEIRNVVVAAGLTPAKATTNQLLLAVQTIIQGSGATYVVDSGTANVKVITPSPAVTAYAAGLAFRVKMLLANTGATTINVSGLGAKSIKRPDGSALHADDLLAGEIALIVYDGTNFQLTALEDPPSGVVRYVNASATVSVGVYLVDTSAGAITLTLPASPAAGDAITFIDAKAYWALNHLTLGRNGHTVMGYAADLDVDVADQQFTIWWNGSDWRLV